MKAVIGIIVIGAIVAGGWYFMAMQPAGQETLGDGHQNDAAGISHEGEVPTPGTYSVVASESRVDWAAGKPLIAGYTHRGYFPVSGGSIEVGEDAASGSFTINMAGLVVTSLGGGKDGQESGLERHLKNEDFFDTNTYPTATFEVTSVAPAPQGGYVVNGTLTLKDVTRPVSIPANIYLENGQLHVHADFSIDRTEWGITFGSASLFASLAENAIGDTVDLSLKIIANPAN